MTNDRMTNDRPICMGITGASGAVYAVRLLDVLVASGRDVHLSISPSGRDVIRQELGRTIDLNNFRANDLLSEDAGRVHYYPYQDFMAPMASGSFLSAGMVICPCSGGTLSAVATGAAGNLIQRAAEVHLKEHRKLILVPRETPLSLVHLRNLTLATEAGAIVLPAAPGFYHRPTKVQELVDFIVQRVLDHLGVAIELVPRWGG